MQKLMGDEGRGVLVFLYVSQVSVYFRHETEEPSLSKEEVDIDTVLREFFEDEDNGESIKVIKLISFLIYFYYY